MQNQAYIFIIFILNGFLIGILFDIFRIFRKCFKTPDFITYVQDIIFGILSGLSLLYSIFKFNNGELRLFIFLGILLGVTFYMLIFSRLFINIIVSSITLIKKIINIIIIIPIKYILQLLRKIIYTPIKYIFSKIVIFLRKILQFFMKKTKKIQLSKIFYKNKKDFA